MIATGKKKGSATVLHDVNGRFEKRFSNSFFSSVSIRDVGFFEAWVSVFDEGLNRDCRLIILAVNKTKVSE